MNNIIEKENRVVVHLRKYLPYYLMILPGVVYLIIFKYVPMFGSVIAFQDFSSTRGIIGSPFVGLKHFIKLFDSPDFYKIFRNSLFLSALKIVFTFPIPVILALMLDEVRSKYIKKSVQTVI